ncbi:hypothetical protein DV736_g2663, partial [Chaetothyriales sp. CBS 134916]
MLGSNLSLLIILAIIVCSFIVLACALQVHLDDVMHSEIEGYAAQASSPDIDAQVHPTDAKANNPRHQAIPSEPATGSMHQPRPDLSQQLWNRAYDTLAKDEAKLVDPYVKILAKVLAEDILEDRSAKNVDLVANHLDERKDLVSKVLDELNDVKVKKPIDHTLATGASHDDSAELERLKANILAKLKDPTKRQIFMDMLVQTGKPKAAKAQKISETVGNIAGTVLSIKPAVDIVLQIPQAAPAALPWAGICLGLAILSNPAKAVQSQRDGIAYVASRMDWYCAITDHLLDQDNKANVDKPPELILQFLEESLCTLYMAILRYQMKSVCYYYDTLSRQVMKNADWDGARQAVVDAEKTFLIDWNRYKQIQASDLWGQLFKKAEKTEEQLRFIAFYDDDPQDTMTHIERGKGGLCEDMCKWVLEHDKYTTFTSWGESNSPPHRLLCIKGPAGTGKTMLLIGIIRQLLGQPAPLQRHLIKHLRSETQNATKSRFEKDTALEALRRVFKNMLGDEGIRPVYFLVDALDECDEGLEDLIELIFNSLTISQKVRWLVSSRTEEVNLTKNFKNIRREYPDSAQTLDELDVVQSVRDQVEIYLKHRLKLLVPNGPDPDGDLEYTKEIWDLVTKEVRERAKDNLLWVSLVFNDIKDTRGWYALQKIRSYPSGLSKLYDHKITKLNDMKTEDRQHCCDVLMAASLAYNLPLSLSELAVLVPWSAKTDPFKVVSDCNYFLTIKTHTKHGKTVDVIHKSAKDYLDGHRDRLQGGAVKGHADIVRSSIDAMSSPERDIFRLGRWNLESKIIAPLERDRLVSIQYSCVFWLNHLHDAIKATTPETYKDLCDATFKFLKEHFLHWLESLGILHQLSVGIVSIRELLSILKVYW